MLIKFFVITTALLAVSMVQASTTYEGLRCEYNDSGELKNSIFKLSGSLNVLDSEVAELSYSAIIYYPSNSDYHDHRYSEIEENIVFSSSKKLKNIRYRGRKYDNHYQFVLDWSTLGAHIEYADLIISKNPVGPSYVDEFGRTVNTFKGAINISYNDHHGDTVWVKCSQTAPVEND